MKNTETTKSEKKSPDSHRGFVGSVEVTPYCKRKPQNQAGERESTIIASLLQAPVGETIPEAIVELLAFAPDSFKSPECGAIAVAIRECSPGGTFPAFEAVYTATRKDFQPEAMRLSNVVSLPVNLVDIDAQPFVKEYKDQRAVMIAREAVQAAIEDPRNTRQFLEKALRNIATISRPDPGLTVRSPEDILEMTFPANDSILGERLLCEGQPLTILGAGGVGKSRLALQLACCVITGRDFLKFKTNQAGSTWLFLQTENSNRRLQSDLLSLKRWLGNDWGIVNECLRLHTIENDEDGLVNLDNPDNVRQIERTIAAHKPSVVVFDPLGEFGIGDLNTDKDMRATVQALSRIVRRGNPDRAMVVLHHSLTGKSGAARAVGFERASFGRNSKVLHSWTRGQINVAQGVPDNNDTLVILCGKCSNGPEFSGFAIKLNRESMIYEVDMRLNASASQVPHHKEGKEI